MIGDRAEDIIAARAHGVRAVAAGWGYGSVQEFAEAQPEHVAETVEDLVAWVRHGGNSAQNPREDLLTDRASSSSH